MKFTDEEILTCLLTLTDRQRLAKAEAGWALFAVGVLLLMFFASEITETTIYATCLIFCGLKYTYATRKVTRIRQQIERLCKHYDLDVPEVS